MTYDSVQITKTKKLLIFLVLIAVFAFQMFSASTDKGSKNHTDRTTSAENITDTAISAEVGEYITFGTYEQDNDTSNDKEPIEWLVLDAQEDKALVISKYALDCQLYNTDMVDITWEECSLRAWLNNEFLSEAFSDLEVEKIISSTVSADKSVQFSTNSGNPTVDKIFLLSITETERYFDSEEERCCTATEYAKAQGSWDGSPNGNCWWWMRSPALYQNRAAYINHDGKISEEGDYVNYGDNAVRPAMWIEINQ